MNDEYEAIDSVLFIPRNKHFGQFFLNGSDEPHSMHYDDIKRYLANLDPSNAFWIDEYISTMRIFIMFPKDQQIMVLNEEELSPDELHAKTMESMRRVPKKKTKKTGLQEKAEALLKQLYHG